ncbi:MAG: excinuclease ABC subunit C [Saprospiraceae bacterium]|nr:excinuclease ABC subunit C [Saprospiraceae bacterium]
MNLSEFKEFSIKIPTDPGVYRFLDKSNEILYVGKAKNLKNRLNSYFGEKKHVLAKTRALIKHAHHIEFTIVETEHDALLLENSLIKTHQPRYNVMLKDGKTYAYICIKNEPFPRVYFTRKIYRDGSTYFGPYTSKYRAEIIVDLIKTLFPLRSCSLNLSAAALSRSKYKVCLEYHIKNCSGPCEHYESEAEYQAKIVQIKNILKGHFRSVKEHIHSCMLSCAERMDFESAQLWKTRLEAFQDYQSKSTVVNPNIQDVDVFSFATLEDEIFIHFMKVIDGAIIHTFTIDGEKNVDDDEEKILSLAIQKIRSQFESIAPEIIVPIPVQLEDEKLVITIPKIGDKKHLLELSEKNINFHVLQVRKDRMNRAAKSLPSERVLRTLQADLHLKEIPFHIECFDNSNIQGTSPVAACVVFKNAKPSKKDYRHFHIKTVEGPNDFASMEEVVFRRYKRLLDEEQSLPQLIIIDGGKGQLSSAMKSILALGIQDKVNVIGIAKKLEEIYFAEDPIPLHINKKSESLKLIQQLRNEAHRFGLTFHRNVRSKKMTGTALTQIKGLGKVSAQKLLNQFHSIPRVLAAPIEEVEKIVGKKMTKLILDYYNSEDRTTSFSEEE